MKLMFQFPLINNDIKYLLNNKNVIVFLNRKQHAP